MTDTNANPQSSNDMSANGGTNLNNNSVFSNNTPLSTNPVAPDQASSSTIPPVMNTVTPQNEEENPFFRAPNPVTASPTMPGFGSSPQPAVQDTMNSTMTEPALPAFTMPAIPNAADIKPEEKPLAEQLFGKPVDVQANTINYNAPAVPVTPEPAVMPDAAAPMSIPMVPMPPVAPAPVQPEVIAPVAEPTLPPIAAMPESIPQPQANPFSTESVTGMPAVESKPISEMAASVEMPETKKEDAKPAEVGKTEVTEVKKEDAVASNNRIGNLLLLLLVIGLAIASLILGIIFAVGQR